tara:strand:- start:285 stop:449 length:165 start_codon:yes stop_codon:yes gene_type:complete
LIGSTINETEKRRWSFGNEQEICTYCLLNLNWNFLGFFVVLGEGKQRKEVGKGK